MIGYIIQRLLSILLTFGVVSILLFMMMHAMPGGPFDATEMPLSGAAKATIMAQYGLDQPLYVQYFK